MREIFEFRRRRTWVIGGIGLVVVVFVGVGLLVVNNLVANDEPDSGAGDGLVGESSPDEGGGAPTQEGPAPAGTSQEAAGRLENAASALRVEELEGGLIGVRFSRPVTVLGDVRLVTDVGAFVMKGERERVGLVVFDTSGYAEDFTVKSIFVGVGGSVKDDAALEANLSFPVHAVRGDRATRSLWADRMSQRPRVEFVSTADFRHDPVRGAYVGSILVVFSEDVRYSTDIEMVYGREPAGEPEGAFSLDKESIEKMANWAVGVREASFMAVTPSDEYLWVHGLSYKGDIRDLGGHHARRSFEPFAIAVGTGEVLTGIARCVDWLRREGIADEAFLQSVQAEGLVFTDEQRVLARERIGDHPNTLAACADAWSEPLNDRNRDLRNWGYVECLDSMETAMLRAEAVPSHDNGRLTDAWMEAKALAYLPYEALTTAERVQLRHLMSTDSCILFYPQLFYSRWIPEAEADVLDE